MSETRYDPTLHHDSIRKEYGLPPVSEQDKDFARRFLKWEFRSWDISQLRENTIHHIYLKPHEVDALRQEELLRKESALEKERLSRTLVRASEAPNILLRPAGASVPKIPLLLRPFYRKAEA